MIKRLLFNLLTLFLISISIFVFSQTPSPIPAPPTSPKIIKKVYRMDWRDPEEIFQSGFNSWAISKKIPKSIFNSAIVPHITGTTTDMGIGDDDGTQAETSYLISTSSDPNFADSELRSNESLYGNMVGAQAFIYEINTTTDFYDATGTFEHTLRESEDNTLNKEQRKIIRDLLERYRDQREYIAVGSINPNLIVRARRFKLTLTPKVAYTTYNGRRVRTRRWVELTSVENRILETRDIPLNTVETGSNPGFYENLFGEVSHMDFPLSFPEVAIEGAEGRLLSPSLFEAFCNIPGPSGNKKRRSIHRSKKVNNTCKVIKFTKMGVKEIDAASFMLDIQGFYKNIF